MDEDDLGSGDTPQVGFQTLLQHRTRKRRRSDVLELEKYSSESAVGNETEYIHATDVTIGLRRIPVGFYVAVNGDNVTKRTLNKPVSAGKDAVEWDDEIVLPSDRLSIISFTVFASFELGPTLGAGEVVRRFEITIGEVLDRAGRLKVVRFSEQSGEGGTHSSSSFEIEIERRDSDRYEYTTASNPPEPGTPQLGELTDRGHHALIHYREHEERRDLEESIGHFERVRELCPADHPCRAVVLFNLATAKLIECRVNDVSSDLDVPIDLYRAALGLRPRGHPDHPFTLLSLGIALKARFQRRRDEADWTEGETLLSQVLDVALEDSYARLVGVLALGSVAKSVLIQPTETAETNENDPDEADESDDETNEGGLHETDESDLDETSESDLDDDELVERLDAALQKIFDPDSCRPALLDHLGILFCIRFNCLSFLADSEKAISMLETVAKLASDNHPDKSSWLEAIDVLLVTHNQHFNDVVNLGRSISMWEDGVQATPDGDPDKPSCLNNLGVLLVTRYQRTGDIRDLEKSIPMFEDAVQLTLDGHPDKPAMLNSLGSSLLTRYERRGNIGDLEKSVSTLEDVVQLTPDGDPDKPSWMRNLGGSLLVRYEHTGDIDDLKRSVSIFEDVVRLTPDGHPDKPARLNSLGNSLATRYRRLGDVVDLQKSVSVFEAAVQFTPDGHPDKPGRLSNLGISFSARYHRTGDIVDLERSVSIFENVVQLTPDGHTEKPSYLGNLGSALLAHYRYCGDVVDLQRSISLFEDAVQLTPDGHLDKPSRLINLGSSLIGRYRSLGDVVDLERSISLSEDAVQLTHDGNPDKCSYLHNLGISLVTRYQRTGDIADLEKSISMFENAVQFTRDGHPDKHSQLNSLGSSMLARYEHTGDIIDLKRSISTFEDAVRLTPDGHPDKFSRMNNLGNTMLARYDHIGDIGDLEKSISLLEGAMRLTPNGHPDKPSQLRNFGNLLLARYRHFGNIRDLEKSISMLEDVVRSTPDGHPDKYSRLNSLGSSMLARYERSGNTENLEKLISMLEDAIQLTPDGHPERRSRLNNLGSLIFARYERMGDVVDLQKSILMKKDAVQLTPDGHPDKPSRLNNLGSSMLARYERTGDTDDLEKSISMFADAAQSTADGHPDKPAWLSDLGRSLSIRYERFGDVDDAERSILMFEDAVQFITDDHPDKPMRLNNLGNSTLSRYERIGDVRDLEKSISMFDNAVQLTPDGDPNKPSWLNNLGNSILALYGRTKDIADLEKSVLTREDAVQLTPDGHPDKPSWMGNLGHSILARYELFGDAVDLQRSISIFEDVMQSTPDGHPDKSSHLRNLALSFLKRFQLPGDSSSSDLPRAILYSSQAARSQTSPSLDRFQAAQLWIECARLLQHDPQSLLDAYAVAVDLLPQLAWIGLSLHDRYHQLLQAADEVCDAAAAALEACRPELAVEWLEQGRSIMWSQLSQLRTPVDNIRILYPDLAARFERVSHELERASARDRAAVNRFAKQSSMMDRLLEERAQQYHALALSRDKLLAEIRAIPGFERFLLPKTIDQLSPLAHSGPVVFLKASKHRCDALIVMAGSEHVIHVPLLDTSYDEVVDMQLRLNKGAKLRRITPDDVFGSILPYLWNKVVSPILEILASSLSTSGSKFPRIFWCPTGPFTFLPVHAAGIYATTGAGPKLSDFAVSSYIPTMSALEIPQEDPGATSRSVRLLTVRQPSTDGQAHLNGVQKEVEVIQELLSSSPFVGLQEADGTVEDVLTKMAETDWAHFACHGTQDRDNPLESGLLLAHRKRLKPSDMVRLSRPRSGLAFLSACHTATGDEGLSEEAIHIAAGMLHAGYRGVIATMWTIMDSDAPRVTEDVYRSLFQDGKVPDSRQAAEALHHAIKRLRDSGASFLSWVPFIHVGL